MPQHKSCEKRMRNDAIRQARNRAARSALRTELRKYRELPEGDRAGAYAGLQSAVDKAVRKGIIAPNKAARLKSRLKPQPAPAA